MASEKSNYPRDEFDRVVGNNGGAHRGNKTIVAQLMPYIIAIIVAGLCALMFLTWTNGWLGRNGLNFFPSTSTTTSRSASNSSSKSTSSESSSSNNSDSKSSTQSDSQSNTQSDNSSTQQTAQPDKSRAVYVINATGITGYAAQRAAVLTNAGYTSVTPANPASSNLPSANTVWYVNDSDQVTAQDIATQLGISQVQKVSGLNQGDIAVILVQQ